MPVISRFHGITIKMYLRQKEHNPPHIHAICGECIGMFEGDIPIKEQRLVRLFIEQNREQLVEMWKSQNFRVLPFEA